jgi:hypothetical protein
MYGLAAGPEGSEEVDSAAWSTVREAALPSPLTTENRRRDQGGMVPLGTLGYSRAESPLAAQPAGRVAPLSVSEDSIPNAPTACSHAMPCHAAS